MEIIKTLSETFLNYSSLFYWRDVIEISFFASLFYYAAIWLKRDRQKNLLPAFYGYCFTAFGAHFFGLTTISYTLFLFAPVTAMIFILIHQDLLQKNIVALKNITPAKRIHLDWLETFIRTSLFAINDGKSITCIIEQSDALSDFLKTPLLFNAELDQGLLDILLASSTFDETKMIWINTKGQLVGINATWINSFKNSQLEPNVKLLPTWKQQAIFFTTKTDCLVVHIDSNSRTFDVVTNGMVIDRMHAAKTLEFIKKYVVSKKVKVKSGVMKYEKTSQKSTTKQHTN